MHQVQTRWIFSHCLQNTKIIQVLVQNSYPSSEFTLHDNYVHVLLFNCTLPSASFLSLAPLSAHFLLFSFFPFPFWCFCPSFLSLHFLSISFLLSFFMLFVFIPVCLPIHLFIPLSVPLFFFILKLYYLKSFLSCLPVVGTWLMWIIFMFLFYSTFPSDARSLGF